MVIKYSIHICMSVSEKNIRIITIKIFNETGEEFPILENVVTCRLNVRHRTFLVQTYIRNYVSNIDQFWIL